jgi:hypothetical protein
MVWVYYRAAPVDMNYSSFLLGKLKAQRWRVRGHRGYWIEDAPIGLIGGGGSTWNLTEEDIV